MRLCSRSMVLWIAQLEGSRPTGQHRLHDLLGKGFVAAIAL